MLKKLLFFLSLFIFLLFPKNSFAAGEFSTDVSVNYNVQESGITDVTHTITLENLYSNLYATSYTLVLDNIEPKNISVHEDGKSLTFSDKQEGTKTSLTVNFPNALVGKGERRTFSVKFEESGFALRTGEVWEI